MLWTVREYPGLYLIGKLVDRLIKAKEIFIIRISLKESLLKQFPPHILIIVLLIVPVLLTPLRVDCFNTESE